MDTLAKAGDMPPPPASLLDSAALFLDFDGTLVELAETPDGISVAPGLSDLLRRVCRKLEGRLAIISGRSIVDLERHTDCRGIAVSGSHGLELRLSNGDHIPLSAPVNIRELRGQIDAFAQGVPGLLVEEKPSSIALHYRQAPDAAEEVRAFLAALARKCGLTVQGGKMVAELRPKGADKGDALRAFMTEPEFAGARPLFVGDDLTDEDAFEAAAGLGGAGILVGPARASAASFRFPGVPAVMQWLKQAAA
ncbi:MAG TPA: trehalose-phosphatase [Allosphingosinicella sp.]|nr:trehalose-phosphatase [Allosphingosinicella sp.]